MTTRAPDSIFIKDQKESDNLFIAYPTSGEKIPLGFFHEKSDADLFAAAPDAHQLLKDLQGMIFENAPFDRYKVAMRLREYFNKAKGVS